MKQIYVESYYRNGYSPVLNTGFIKYISNILGHPKQKSIEQRLRIIEFCDEFSFRATREAFGKSRATFIFGSRNLSRLAFAEALAQAGRWQALGSSPW